MNLLTLKALMGWHSKAEIVCPYKGTVVRRLTVDGHNLLIDALTETVTVSLDTELIYEPWTFDRGSMLFNLPGRGILKFCTEMDIIRFEDGDEQMVTLERFGRE